MFNYIFVGATSFGCNTTWTTTDYVYAYNNGMTGC